SFEAGSNRLVRTPRDRDPPTAEDLRAPQVQEPRLGTCTIEGSFKGLQRARVLDSGEVPCRPAAIEPRAIFNSNLQTHDGLNARAALKKAQEAQEVAYNKKRRDAKIREGDQVLLRRDAITHDPRLAAKYRAPYIGPYKVTHVEAKKDNYCLKLPPGMRIHPVFHVSNLRRYTAAEEGRRVNRPGPTKDDESSQLGYAKAGDNTSSYGWDTTRRKPPGSIRRTWQTRKKSSRTSRDRTHQLRLQSRRKLHNLHQFRLAGSPVVIIARRLRAPAWRRSRINAICDHTRPQAPRDRVGHGQPPFRALGMLQHGSPVDDGVGEPPQEVILHGPKDVVLRQYEFPSRDRPAVLHAEAHDQMMHGLVHLHSRLRGTRYIDPELT
ncbi:MAG: hypothetical protein BJ554DRAFT_7407, partial [Olpidium bornovanus]